MNDNFLVYFQMPIRPSFRNIAILGTYLSVVIVINYISSHLHSDMRRKTTSYSNNAKWDPGLRRQGVLSHSGMSPSKHSEGQVLRATQLSYFKSEMTQHTTTIQQYTQRTEPLPKRTQFQFYINEENMCKHNENKVVKLLIVVYVAVGEVAERGLIREGWGKVARENSNCRLIFLLGEPRDGNITMVTELMMESRDHQDMVAADYTDTYRNLTLKSFAMFQWVAQYCHHAQYVLKIDSDVEINVTKLLQVIETQPLPDKFICGRTWKNARVDRQKISKWYVSKTDYQKNTYPLYCVGHAFIITKRIISKLSPIPIPFRRPFPVDDVYITGIMRERINETINTGLFRFSEETPTDERLHGRRMIHVVF